MTNEEKIGIEEHIGEIPPEPQKEGARYLAIGPSQYEALEAEARRRRNLIESGLAPWYEMSGKNREAHLITRKWCD